ncbi:hypothetical protein WS9_015650 [Paraclostridium sordellii 8483]|uniref:hypothetical protein n=1 Tax=Paraclostridium sordellii TaxID=1505 RepID=UPI0002F1B896|nr:hypothetical protein [Paeniclostridium sordellii]TAN63558.1 hypothetical protein WS9_015650 [Paeniclostridium sordellii 8483]
MKIYLHYEKDSFTFNGFYLEEYNHVIPSPNIIISPRLWEYLLSLTSDFKLKENFELKELYTIEDKDIFETIPFVYEEPKPTRIDVLEQENADLLLDSALKDSKIEQLENDLSDLMFEVASIGGN